MGWRLIIKEFGLNIQHIGVVEKIVADTISIFTSKSVKNYKPSTSKAQCHANELFTISMAETKKISYH